MKVNDSPSDTYSVAGGVPQSGVLSPILSIIYLNVKRRRFPDDIKLYKIISKPEDCLALQRAIEKIEDCP